MEQPRPTAFINVLAWVFILLAAGGVVMGVIQNVIIHFWPPLADVVDQYQQTAPTTAGVFGVQMLMGNLQWIMALNLLISIVVLIAAVGLLKRMNWARIAFIAFMLLGIVWAIASFILLVQADPIATASLEAPAEYQPALQGARAPSLLVGGLFTLLLSALLGWIASRLRSPEVAEQFHQSR